MPTGKDFKRLVRGRMQKTGESYTAARAILLKKPARKPAPLRPATPDYAALAGMSDATIHRRGGTFEATRSKTTAVPVARLFRAFSDARMRNKWLPDVKLTVRNATPTRSVRITWEDDTSVEVLFTAKAEARSTVALAHRKLASRADAIRRKAYWGERLEALAGILTRKH
jgi:hypothetical protein